MFARCMSGNVALGNQTVGQKSHILPYLLTASKPIPPLNPDILILFPDSPISLTPNNMSLVHANLLKSFFDSSSVVLHW